MTVDTAATANFFDFDELEKAYAKISEDVQGSPPPEELTDLDEDGLDTLSEIWPGELPSAEDDFGDLPELVPGPQLSRRPRVWEVCVLRVIVRREADVDAAVQGLCHERELLFEEPDGPENNDWVCLERQRGFVLKDGSRKDPKLGFLVRPLALPHVLEEDLDLVCGLLRSTWRRAREQNGLLRPQLVTKLRRAEEDAVTAALTASGFDADAFESEYQRGVDGALSEQGFLAQARVLMQKAAAAGQQGGSRLRYAERAKGSLDQAAVSQWVAAMRARTLPSQEDAIETVASAAKLFGQQPTLVRLQLPPGATLHVVGDVHGQFWDLLHILEICGEPSSHNQYLFNGDFVDRGQFSVEVALLLLAMKVAAPKAVHLNRGNHEAVRMNALYGFMQETEQKYSNELFRQFAEAFRNLPLATVVNDSVFVVHGGLSSKDGVRLSEISQLDRKREPDEIADQLMLDLLWSDPMERDGYAQSPRGGGILFGPDVTQRFCEQNGLSCVIRSHEMKSKGYEWQRLGRCLTVFSAPNYCDMCGNLGAVCDIQAKPGQRRVSVGDLNVRTFDCSPHPEEPNVANTMFRPFC